MFEQAIHEGANCKQYQDQVNENAESNEDARRTKEMIEVRTIQFKTPTLLLTLARKLRCNWPRIASPLKSAALHFIPALSHNNHHT